LAAAQDAHDASTNNTVQKGTKKTRKKRPFGTNYRGVGNQGGSRIWCLAHLVRLEQSHADLNATPLAVRNSVEAPLQVYVQKINQLLAACRVYPLHSMNHLPCCQVTLQQA